MDKRLFDVLSLWGFAFVEGGRRWRMWRLAGWLVVLVPVPGRKQGAVSHHDGERWTEQVFYSQSRMAAYVDGLCNALADANLPDDY